MPESTERGALTEAVYYMLLSLYTPVHGYGMIKKIASMSGGRVNLGAGTLYGAITTLLDKGWITAAGEYERRKEYVITDLGKAMVADEMARLCELLKNGLAVTEGEG